MPAQESSHTVRSRLVRPLAVLALAQLIISLDYNVVYVALPTIGDRLGFAASDLQWVVNAYVVATGGFLLLGGRATDLLGRRRMFLAGALGYAISSLVGALAWAPGVLVAVRAVQGLAGSLLFPATLSLVNTLHAEGPERHRALAIWGAAGAGGLSFGSLLGGVLVAGFGWPAVFFVNVPLAVSAAFGGLLLFPADGPGDGTRRLDVPGAVTGTAGVTLLVFLLVRVPDAGWNDASVPVAAALAGVLLGVFVAVEHRFRDPLVPSRLFAHRGLTVALGVTALFSATFSALPYFLTRYFQGLRGYGAFATGLAFLLPSFVVAAGTRWGARVLAGRGAGWLLAGGLALGALGSAALALCLTAEGSYVRLVPGIVLLGLGQGAVWTGMWVTASLGVAPGDQGVASGLASTSLQVGGAVGLAALVAAFGGDASLSGVRGAVLTIAVALGCGAVATAAVRHRAPP
ncbi:MFS transporter [Streptomyces sp. NPDC050560]|uniref:MFS transporter n=1 Tax=Streptomyces sp. NPDC050560 TaxID=3365630 RepID=UPI0037B5248D